MHDCPPALSSCSNPNPPQFDKQLNLGLVRSAAARESGLDVEEFEARLQVHLGPSTGHLHCSAVMHLAADFALAHMEMGPRACISATAWRRGLAIHGINLMC